MKREFANDEHKKKIQEAIEGIAAFIAEKEYEMGVIIVALCAMIINICIHTKVNKPNLLALISMQWEANEDLFYD